MICVSTFIETGAMIQLTLMTSIVISMILIVPIKCRIILRKCRIVLIKCRIILQKCRIMLSKCRIVNRNNAFINMYWKMVL